MNAVIAWIAAQSEEPDELFDALGDAELESPEEELYGYEDESNPDLRVYRDRTVTLLRRFLRYSLEAGRVPSLLGREFFRTTVTSYTVTTFEDRVVFAHDVEQCLKRMDAFSREILARVVLQEYGHYEAARVLHCPLRTLERAIPAAIDELSAIFLEVGMLTSVPE